MFDVERTSALPSPETLLRFGEVQCQMGYLRALQNGSKNINFLLPSNKFSLFFIKFQNDNPYRISGSIRNLIRF